MIEKIPNINPHYISAAEAYSSAGELKRQIEYFRDKAYEAVAIPKDKLTKEI